jgi:predicted lipid-binding transport protein (Tim44 family)
MQYAAAGASAGGATAYQPPPVQPLAATPPMQRTAEVVAGGAGTVPAGFDAKEFERIAKMIFIRMQAANDAGEVEDLRKFTTPELFASLRLDLQERGGKAQQTDVVQLDAQLIDTAQENGQWIASVRFSGLIREQADSGADRFDELWHLVKPVDGSREWAIAGITPMQ